MSRAFKIGVGGIFVSTMGSCRTKTSASIGMPLSRILVILVWKVQ